MNLNQLKAYGFTASTHIPFTRQYRVRCEHCEALVINGTPCHETGCSAQVHECRGCSELISTNQRYCASCS